MLVCIGVGAVASLLFHLLVKEEIQAPGQQVEYLSIYLSPSMPSLLFHLLVKEEIQAPGQQVEYLSLLSYVLSILPIYPLISP